ncbi:MAG: hypothetical protein JW773_11680 [Desulfuromonadales bacterium]|nr:hypothetical protein [Desulfuromonadales bacterium]
MQKLNRQQLYLVLPLAAFCALFLFIGGPGYDSLRSFRYLWGAGHLVCFALWVNLYVTVRPKASWQRLVIESLLLVFALGGLTELIQAGIGRQGTWQDLGHDLVGGLIGLFFFSELKKDLSPLLLRVLQIPLLIVVLWTVFPVVRVIADDLVSWQQFPLLSGFETPLEGTRWSGSAQRKRTQEVAFAGQMSLQVRLTTQRYSGIGLKDFPRNWQDYSAVSLQVFNPDQEQLQLHLRIHDHAHNNAYSDRYNASFGISPGWNHLKVPLKDVSAAPKTRSFDLTRVAGLGVFVGKLERPRTIYLDDVRLIP